ncbi:replication initiator [Streptomyces griseoluteus]|uniref:replication initiator n=1 Tax=Streptomyces griseoluteus TaxID=29306 RepID=UPI0038289561
MGEGEVKGLVLFDSAHAQRPERGFAPRRVGQAPPGDPRREHGARNPRTFPRPFGPPSLHASGATKPGAADSDRVFTALTAPWFGPVAEFQKRGAVHCHAWVRIDGPDTPAGLGHRHPPGRRDPGCRCSRPRAAAQPGPGLTHAPVELRGRRALRRHHGA